jgi:hypothetical protein
MRCCPVYSILPPAHQCGVVLFIVFYRQLNKAVLSVYSTVSPAQKCVVVLFIVSTASSTMQCCPVYCTVRTASSTKPFYPVYSIYRQLNDAVLSCLRYQLCLRLQVKESKGKGK